MEKRLICQESIEDISPWQRKQMPDVINQVEDKGTYIKGQVQF
jgi:hypothetical protein